MTAPTRWRIDPMHSVVEFTAKHMMVAAVRGRFRTVGGEIQYDEADPAASAVRASMTADSIDTTVDKRDAHLRSADFLDVENFPELTFRSTAVEITSPVKAMVIGDLTIRDVTYPVKLRTKKLGTLPGMPGTPIRMAFEAATRINRKHWGLTWNKALEAGGWLVGDQVTINIAVEAVQLPS